MLKDKIILLTGGTGSLGHSLVDRIMTGEFGKPKKIIVFSRDEDKHYQMKLEWKNIRVATDEVYYHNPDEMLEFRIGDVRDYEAVARAIKSADIVIHAAAMKHVPVAEYYPSESVKTNIIGTNNIIRAMVEHQHGVESFINISTDKACKPVNVYGMTKAIQERLIIEANLQVPDTKFICVRYGNVVASRGSIIPLYQEQVKQNRELTITVKGMTRFWLTLKQASDVVFDAMDGRAGDTYVPDLDAFRIDDLAEVMIGDNDIPIKYIGIRPGEKIHEILISEEEISRTIKRDNYFIIQPILPELRQYEDTTPVLNKEFSSADRVLSQEKLKELLIKEGLL